MTPERKVAIVKCADGKYRLVGWVWEVELDALSKAGFESYQDALDVLDQFGYGF